MRAPSESTSLRVLMQMPDLSPGPAVTKPAPAADIFEQKPQEPLAGAPPKSAAKAKSGMPTTPEELQAPSMFARSLKVLAGLAIAGVVAAALTNRPGKQRSVEPVTPDKTAADANAKTVPGGSPLEITQIPEISFPQPSAQSDPADAMKIERLPAVEATTSTAQLPNPIASVEASDKDPAQGMSQQPIVARLDGRIEQPKH